VIKANRERDDEFSVDLAVGDDGENDHLGSDHGRLAEDDLELPRRAAALRHGLHIGGGGPRQRAPALEVGRRATARGAVVDALRRRALAVEVDGAAQCGALPAANGLRADHHGHVEAVHEAHAIRGEVEVPAVADRELRDGGRRRGARLAAGRRGVAPRARGHAAGPEGGRHGEGEQRVRVEAGLVVGDGGEAGVRGDQRPDRVRA
jgi:hypothetical protein